MNKLRSLCCDDWLSLQANEMEDMEQRVKAIFVFLDNFVSCGFSVGGQCLCLPRLPHTSLFFLLSSHSEGILIFDTEFHNSACVVYSRAQGPSALRGQCRRMGIIFHLSHLVIMSANVAWPCDRLASVSSPSSCLDFVFTCGQLEAIHNVPRIICGF